MKLAVIGGGSGVNSILPVFESVSEHVAFVVPISDNGGSTSEILRVLGGPAIGDARSRLVRLMPPGPLKQLLAYRLPAESGAAMAEWNCIVSGDHEIWEDVPVYMRNMYGAFFVHVHSELLKRRLNSAQPFDFACASVGNMLLSGARLFFGGSLDSAIEFVSQTTRVPTKFSVMPCLNSNFTHHIAAKLRNGVVVVGQNDISHPLGGSGEKHDSQRLRPHFSLGTPSPRPLSPLPRSPLATPPKPGMSRRSSEALLELPSEDVPPFSHPRLSASQIRFAKEAGPLPSPIERVYYVNTFGDEISPRASPRVLEAIYESDAVVYSVGSLWTSIVPVLVLKGMAEALRHAKRLVLIVNGEPDRETPAGMGPAAFVDAIAGAIANVGGSTHTPYVTHVIHPSHLHVELDHVTCLPAACPGGRYELGSLESAVHAAVWN